MPRDGHISMEKKRLSHVLHITDNHLYRDPDGGKFHVNSIDSLRAVLLQAKQEYVPDVILVSGDVAEDVEDAVYAQLASEVGQHFDAPIVGTPGNHDLKDLFRKYFPQSSIQVGNWQVLTVDTHVDYKLEGFVSDESMQSLKLTLEQSSDPTLVVGHHPILPIGSDWIDPHRVKNGEDVFELLTRFEHVKCYLSGHIHQAHDSMRASLQLLSTPSTCWQFKANSQTFAVDELLAGWRWLHLDEDGSLTTEVHRISD